jgi:hypothetical protein
MRPRRLGAGLAVVVAIILTACAPTPTIPTSPAAVAASPTGPSALSPSVSPALRHASVWGLTFDYPAAWTLSQTNVNEHYITVLGFLGSGSGSVPCTAITPPPSRSYPYGVECHRLTTLPPGSVLIEFQTLQGLAVSNCQGPPASGEAVSVDGFIAYFTRAGQPVTAAADETLQWILRTPGQPGSCYQLMAGIRGPGLTALEAQLMATVATIRRGPPS